MPSARSVAWSMQKSVSITSLFSTVAQAMLRKLWRAGNAQCTEGLLILHLFSSLYSLWTRAVIHKSKQTFTRFTGQGKSAVLITSKLSSTHRCQNNISWLFIHKERGNVSQNYRYIPPTSMMSTITNLLRRTRLDWEFPSNNGYD